MRLSIALPSRGRPKVLRESVKATLACMTLPDTRLVVLLDEDDPTLEEFDFEDERLIVSIAPREDSFGEKYNRVLKAAPADVYSNLSDYAWHRTCGFDYKILQAAEIFPDGIGVIYDRMMSLALPITQAITAKLVEKLGGIYPPWFPYWFVDHWLDDVAHMIDRIACANIVVDNCQRPGTMEKRDPVFWAMFYDLLMLERRKQATDIIEGEDFIEPRWRKDMLLGSMRLWEERSLHINQLVRAMQPGDTTTDERYTRIKTRAMEKLCEIAPTIEAMAA